MSKYPRRAVKKLEEKIKSEDKRGVLKLLGEAIVAIKEGDRSTDLYHFLTQALFRGWSLFSAREDRQQFIDKISSNEVISKQLFIGAEGGESLLDQATLYRERWGGGQLEAAGKDDIFHCLLDLAVARLLPEVFEEIIAHKDSDGQTLLHSICAHGTAEMMQDYLAVTRTTVNRETFTKVVGDCFILKDVNGFTPFHRACKRGDERLVTYLLEIASYSVKEGMFSPQELLKILNQKNKMGYTPLLTLINGESSDSIQGFLDKCKSLATIGILLQYPSELEAILTAKSQFGANSLAMAIIYFKNHSHDERIEYLLNFMHIIQTEQSVLTSEYLRQTPLTQACEQGSFEVVRAIIGAAKQSGCLDDIINMQDYFGNTPLNAVMKTLNKDKQSIIRSRDLTKFDTLIKIGSLLLDSGADPYIENDRSRSSEDNIRHFQLKCLGRRSNALALFPVYITESLERFKRVISKGQTTFDGSLFCRGPGPGPGGGLSGRHETRDAQRRAIRAQDSRRY